MSEDPKELRKFIDDEIKKAVASERERCARLAEELDRKHGFDGVTGSFVADVIRRAVT